jgi:hypothetical protein
LRRFRLTPPGLGPRASAWTASMSVTAHERLFLVLSSNLSQSPGERFT